MEQKKQKVCAIVEHLMKEIQNSFLVAGKPVVLLTVKHIGASLLITEALSGSATFPVQR